MPSAESAARKKTASTPMDPEEVVQLFASMGRVFQDWAQRSRAVPIDPLLATSPWGAQVGLESWVETPNTPQETQSIRRLVESLDRIEKKGWERVSDATLARGVLELFEALSQQGRALGATRLAWNLLRTHPCGQRLEGVMLNRAAGISNSLFFQFRLKSKEKHSNHAWAAQQSEPSSVAPAVIWAHAVTRPEDWLASKNNTWAIADAQRAMLEIAQHAKINNEHDAHEVWRALVALREIEGDVAHDRSPFWAALAKKCPALIGWLEASETVLRHPTPGTGWGSNRWLPSLSLEHPQGLSSFNWSAPSEWKGAAQWNARLASTPQEQKGALDGLKPQAWVHAIGFDPQWLQDAPSSGFPLNRPQRLAQSQKQSSQEQQAEASNKNVGSNQSQTDAISDVEQLFMSLQQQDEEQQGIEERQKIAAGIGLWLNWGAPEGPEKAQHHAQKWAQACHPDDAAHWAQQGWLLLQDKGAAPLLNWYEQFRRLGLKEAFHVRRSHARWDATGELPVGVQEHAHQALKGLLGAGVSDASVDDEGNSVLLKAVREGSAQLAWMLAQEHPSSLEISNQNGRFVADLALQALSVERSKSVALQWDALAQLGLKCPLLTHRSRLSIELSAQKIQKEQKHALSAPLFAAIERSALKLELGDTSKSSSEMKMPESPAAASEQKEPQKSVAETSTKRMPRGKRL